MGLFFADRVKETSTTPGTGTLSLAGAATGFRTFVAAGAGGLKVRYAIVQSGGNWETGIGTITDATPDTLSRDSVTASSNAGSLVNFGAVQKDVFIVAGEGDIRWHKIASSTLTGAGTEDFESGLDGTYDYIEWRFRDVEVTDSTVVSLRVKEAGAYKSGASDYQYNYHELKTVESFASNTASDRVELIISNFGGGTGEKVNGIIRLSGPDQASLFKVFRFDMWGMTNAGTVMTSYGSGAYVANSNAITGVQFLPNTGTLETGTIEQWGA